MGQLVIGYGCAKPCGDRFSTALRIENVQVYCSAKDAGKTCQCYGQGDAANVCLEYQDMEYTYDRE
jgi:hypothetical protein